MIWVVVATAIIVAVILAAIMFIRSIILAIVTCQRHLL